MREKEEETQVCRDDEIVRKGHSAQQGAAEGGTLFLASAHGMQYTGGMHCPSCKFENPEGKKFCEDAGPRSYALARVVTLRGGRAGSFVETVARPSKEERNGR